MLPMSESQTSGMTDERLAELLDAYRDEAMEFARVGKDGKPMLAARAALDSELARLRTALEAASADAERIDKLGAFEHVEVESDEANGAWGRGNLVAPGWRFRQWIDRLAALRALHSRHRGRSGRTHTMPHLSRRGHPHAPARRQLSVRVGAQVSASRPALLLSLSAEDTVSETLTVEALLALVAEFPPPPRVIVGFPLCAPDKALKHEGRNLLLIGSDVWKQFVKVIPVTSAPLNTFSGVPVEFFDKAREDHRGLLYALLREMGKALAPKPAAPYFEWHDSRTLGRER